MKFKLIFLSLGLLSFFNCQAPTAVQNDGKSSGSLQVNVEVPLSGQNRGLFSDGSVALITVKVTDASDVVVGTGTLTKGSSAWNGTINLTATGTLTFSVRAMDGSNNPLYGGVVTQLVSGATTISVPVMAKTLMGGSVQGVPLDLTKTVSSLAGYGFTGADGTGAEARFNSPQGVTSDGTNLYVTDIGNNTIRKVVIATGVVTTLAGKAGTSGSADGTGSEANFYGPYGITNDGTSLFVADCWNHTIRKVVISTGEVSTLAGTPGGIGSTDGTGSIARFNSPFGITNDGTNLYVTDVASNTIRQIVIATGVVTTLTGSAGASGSIDGTGTLASFFSPRDITTDGINLYVADSNNHTIRKVLISTGVVTTIAGTAGSFGSADGTGSVARFYNLSGISTDGINLYVSDTANRTIRKVVIATGVVTTLAGSIGANGSTDGTGSVARFSNLTYITNDGTHLYVSDTGNHTIRKVILATGVVSTIAGSADLYGSSDGTGMIARFNSPRGITNDGTNLFVIDVGNHTIRKVVMSTGEVTTFAGSAGTWGSSDGMGSTARFKNPDGIINDGTNLFVTDAGNHTIRMVVIATREVTTLAGMAGISGSSDDTGSAARFNSPLGLTSDGTNLFVTDSLNHTIRKIVISSGVVTTLAGTASISGSTDGTGAGARFYSPKGITNDGSNLFVTDNFNHTIRKIVISTGVVTTLAGTATTSGSADGTGSVARFKKPQGITSDRTNLYVTDSDNHTIRKVVIATGLVTTLVGKAGALGTINGTGSAAWFYSPQGITTDGSSLFVADTNNHTIRKIQ